MSAHHRVHAAIARISGPVGAPPNSRNPAPAPLNSPADVRLVQQLLNRAFHDTPTFHALAEDGFCGIRTIAAIAEFQRRFVPGASDGRVDPHGHTIRILSTKAGKPFPPKVVAFLHEFVPAAQAAAKKWHVPASVLLAQAAHESAWGTRVKDNAYFGIKGKSPSGNSTTFQTHEVVAGKTLRMSDSFRAYKDFSEAADDYGRFLNTNPRYSACFRASNDPNKFVDALAAAGYATDPQYAHKIKNIIRKYWLADYER